MRRFWNRPLGSKVILVLSVVMLLVYLAVPWQRTCNVTGTETICGYRFAWQGHDSGLLMGLFAVGLVVWELLPIVIPRLSMRGWPAAVVTLLLALGLSVVTLAKLIVDNEFQIIWAWVAFGLTLVILVTAILRVRFRWERRAGEPPASTTT
ncbi:MAG: hypothetical protein ACRC50_12660 [Gaiella sp.]